MLSFIRRNYLSIDPRTLALVRIATALLLLVDLAKRASVLSLFYVNAGLIPNHRVLWRPPREFTFSWLSAFGEVHEVRVAFALIALIYLCFLVGYRTRLMHVLSWLCLLSLELRVDLLSNGADFVFSDLVLWTAFLPLGERFSLDALARSLRNHADDLGAFARAEAEPRPVVSLAVLAAVTQLTVIYVFNAISKNGATWRDGSAVYWLVHQERIVTFAGLLAREHLPYWCFQALTYQTLVVEGTLPLLIMSPWGRPWTRRLAIALIFALHSGIALLSNLGLFSPVMMAFSLMLVSSEDWRAWLNWGGARSKLRLYVEESTGLCWQSARLWARLDVWQRITLLPMAAEQAPAPEHGGWLVETADGRRFTLEPALRELLWVLPLGGLWVAIAQLLRPLTAPGLRWAARNRRALSDEFGLRPQGAAGPNAAPASTPFALRLQRARAVLCELGVSALMVVAISQTLNENRAIPQLLKHRQPRWIRAGVDYFRLNQGWSMFAPDAPTDDLTIVIDAVTSDGRHIDPYNQLASRVADPELRTIPERLAQAAAFCDYTVRIANDGLYHDPLREWILNYHRRSKRPEDRIVSFVAYVIEQRSPRPGTTAASDVNARIFLRN